MYPLRLFKIPSHGCWQPEYFIVLIDKIQTGVGWLPAVPIGPESQKIRMAVQDFPHIGVIIFTPGSDLP